VYPGVDGALLLPFLLAVHVCSVCKGEGEEIEGLVPIILQARHVRWVFLRPCTAYSVITLSCTRGLSAFEPSSSGLSQI